MIIGMRPYRALILARSRDCRLTSLEWRAAISRKVFEAWYGPQSEQWISMESPARMEACFAGALQIRQADDDFTIPSPPELDLREP